MKTRFFEDVPQVLYKYRTWHDSNDKLSYVRRIITDSEIYLNSAQEFNDPFDFNIPILYDKKEFTKDNIIRNAILHLRNEYAEKSEEYIVDLVATLYNQGFYDYGNENWKQAELMALENAYKEGLFCMSSKRDNILMWSHYADMHKGYCIGFDKMAFAPHSYGALICPIDYKSKFPIMKLDEYADPIQHAARLFTKSKCWSYEKEVRYLKLGSAFSTIKYSNSFVKEIIFGHRINDAHLKEITKLAKVNFPNVKFYKCALNKSFFKLDIQEINTL